jgi:hypothetical protein
LISLRRTANILCKYYKSTIFHVDTSAIIVLKNFQFSLFLHVYENVNFTNFHFHGKVNESSKTRSELPQLLKIFRQLVSKQQLGKLYNKRINKTLMPKSKFYIISAVSGCGGITIVDLLVEEVVI